MWKGPYTTLMTQDPGYRDHQGPKHEDSMAEAVCRITADRMQVILDMDDLPRDIENLLYRIRQQLTDAGVPEEWLGEPLEERLLDAKENGVPDDGLVLVQGSHPQPPEDGYIKWGADFFNPGFVVDGETGNIDYRKRVAQTTVASGQLLAVIVPPKPGVDGRNVYGQAVRAGKGFMPKIRIGPNVVKDEEGLRFYAAKDGRFRWNDDEVLSVDEVYVVEGNVGLETGHIDHPGAILVKGDIEQGTRVKVRGDIEVLGIVERADVETDGNLIVRCGITGMGLNSIRVAGSVHARYIIDSGVEADGDIVVEREILQSTVKTLGTVSMQRGRLVGGKTVARTGMVLGQAGSEALVPTTLIAGHDFRLLDKLDAVITQLAALADEREKVMQEAAVKTRGQARVLGRSGKTGPAQPVLPRRAIQIDREVAELEKELESLKEESKTMTSPRIEITRMVFPETILCCGSRQLRVRDRLRGPVHAVLAGAEVQLQKD